MLPLRDGKNMMEERKNKALYEKGREREGGR